MEGSSAKIFALVSLLSVFLSTDLALSGTLSSSQTVADLTEVTFPPTSLKAELSKTERFTLILLLVCRTHTSVSVSYHNLAHGQWLTQYLEWSVLHHTSSRTNDQHNGSYNIPPILRITCGAAGRNLGTWPPWAGKTLARIQIEVCLRPVLPKEGSCDASGQSPISSYYIAVLREARPLQLSIWKIFQFRARRVLFCEDRSPVGRIEQAFRRWTQDIDGGPPADQENYARFPLVVCGVLSFQICADGRRDLSQLSLEFRISPCSDD